MASSSSKNVTRGGKDGGQERNTTSLDSRERSGMADRGREGREVGWSEGRAPGDAWACWLWIIGLCCPRVEPTSEQSFSCSPTEPIPDRNWYHSARIQRTMEKGGELGAQVEFTKVESEIEASKVHWSEVDRAVSEMEQSAEANRKHFEVLRRKRYVKGEGDQLVANASMRNYLICSCSERNGIGMRWWWERNWRREGRRRSMLLRILSMYHWW